MLDEVDPDEQFITNHYGSKTTVATPPVDEDADEKFITNHYAANPPKGSEGFFDKAKKAIKNYQDQDLSTYQRETAGNVQGARDVLSSVQNLAGKTTLGGVLPSFDENITARNKFNETYGDDPVAGIGRFGGNVLASTPLLMGGEAALGALGGGAAAAVPALRVPLKFLGGTTESNALTNAAGQITKGATNFNKLARLGSKTAFNAEQGAAGQALISSQSDENLADQLEFGAEVGAGLGLAGKALKSGAGYAGNKITNFVEPMSDAGRTRIANRLVRDYGETPLNINTTQFVNGSEPTMAEATGNPGIAQLQDTLQNYHSTPYSNRQEANKLARNNVFEDVAGTPQDREAAELQRATMAEAALGNPDKGIPSQIFMPGQVADVAPVHAKIDEILASPTGMEPSVVKGMAVAKKILQGTRDTPPTGPETLYHSIRKGLDYLEKGNNGEAPEAKNAAKQIRKVKQELDKVIEAAAPGYTKYQKDFASASGPIDAMEWLQGLNIKDQEGNITLSKVQSQLRNINKIKGTTGLSKAKHLTTTQIATLENIRDDLLREKNLYKGKAYGSQTHQREMAEKKLTSVLNNSNPEGSSNKLSLEAKLAGLGAMAGGATGIPGANALGAMAGSKAGNVLGRGQAVRNAMIREKLQNIMLNPQSYVVPTQSGPSALNNLVNSPLLHYGATPSILSAVGVTSDNGN